MAVAAVAMVTTSQRLQEMLGRVIAATPAGERLPSEPKLASQLGVSRATLREAMRAFETQGLIHRRQGIGTFVTRPSQVIESGLEVLESIETLAQRVGLSVSTSEMRLTQRTPSAEEALALGINESTAVVDISRVIMAEGHPAAYLVDILPQDVISRSDLQEKFTGSVLDILLKDPEIHLNSSRCEINAVTATPEVARAMRIQRGDVLLRFVAYLYTSAGRVIDYSYSYFLPGSFHFHVVRRVGSNQT